MPMIGFSGPRLTPPASISTSASASPGRHPQRQRRGDQLERSPGPGPACPGTYRTTSPTSRPVAVSTPMIHSAESDVQPDRRAQVVPDPVLDQPGQRG